VLRTFQPAPVHRGILILVLYQAYLLHTGTHNNLHTIMHNLLCGGGNRHQSGRALTVHRHSTDRHGQAGGQCGEATGIQTAGTLWHCTAQDHIIHLGWIDT